MSSLSGVVREGETGRLLAGVTVFASIGRFATPGVVTDQSGQFRLTGLAPGEYLVRAFRDRSTAERAGVRVTRARPSRVVLYLDEPPLPALPRGRPRIRMFLGSDVDRARCCVDQSPHQLRR